MLGRGSADLALLVSRVVFPSLHLFYTLMSHLPSPPGAPERGEEPHERPVSLRARSSPAKLAAGRDGEKEPPGDPRRGDAP